MGLSAPAQDYVTPQQVLWQQTYKSVKNHNELDSNFEKVKVAITQHVSLLQRQAQVRVKNWLKKLSEQTANVVWKKNRNSFAKLLLEQLRTGRLAEPFHQMPPDGPLPTLPKHAVYAFAQLRSPTRQEHRPSASEALDEYLGRQDFQQLQVDAEEAQPLQEPEPAVIVLPGTRMRLVGAEARQVDRQQLQDTQWQPSKLELEAQLGASRERERELQWRLQQTEEMLRQQGTLLQQALREPVRLQPPSQLSALDDVIDDEHISPPQKRVGRKELQQLIDKYEERRRHWQIPAWPRTAPGRIGPLEDGDEEEILEHLDNFQRNTEAIRKHLARRTVSSSDDAPASLAAMSSGLGGASSSFRTGLEPSLSMAGGPPLPPLYSPASPTVADGLTPARSALPHGLLATAWGGTRPAGRTSLFEGLPESPTLGPGRAAQRAPTLQAALPQQPATSAASVSFGGGGGGHDTPALPRRPASPVIRHTLKSAAAAQKNGPAKASPSGVSTGAATASSQQQRHGQQGAMAQAEPAAAAGQFLGHDDWQGRQAGGAHASLDQQQQQQQQQQRDSPAGTASIAWGPVWQQQERQQQQREYGAADEDGSEYEAEGSNAQLASGAADLRRRLEQQLGEAGGGAAAADTPREPLGSRSRGAYRPGASSRSLLPPEHSSEEFGGRQAWQVSHKYRLSDMSDAEASPTVGSRQMAALGSSSRFRLTDLGDSDSLLMSSTRPDDPYRLAEDGSSGRVGGLRAGDGDPDLAEFQRQTEKLKAQIAALKVLDDTL